MKKEYNLWLFICILTTLSCEKSTHKDNPFSNSDLKENIVNRKILYDSANLLMYSEKQILINKIREFEDNYGSQISIIIVDNIVSGNIKNYSIKKGNEIGIGRKKFKDALLICISVSDRVLRIEVGIGLQRIITDQIVEDIINKELIPNFKTKNYFQGIDKAIDRITLEIKNNQNLLGKAL